MGLWMTNTITKYRNTSWKPTNMNLRKWDPLTKKGETLEHFYQGFQMLNMLFFNI